MQKFEPLFYEKEDNERDERLLREFRERNRITKANFWSPPRAYISNAPKMESRDRTYSSFVYSQNASVSSFHQDGQSGGSSLNVLEVPSTS